MTCPNEKCNHEMYKKSESQKWTEYICPKCRSLRTVMKLGS